MRTRPSHLRPEIALALGLVAAAALLTSRFVPGVDVGLDGAFYLHVAHHVARGHGFVTSLSLYHQGLDPLPQASTVYPLWPWLLSGFVRALGLEQAGTLAPKLLYVLDTGLVYVVLDRVASRLPAGGRVHPRVLLGFPHIGMLLFATNPVLFWSTSLPYSEGLAFALLLLSLLAVDVAVHRSGAASLTFAAGAGLLAGAAYLTRFQAVTAPLAVAAGLALAGPRGIRLKLAVTSITASAFLLVGEGLYLAGRPGFRPAMLLDFASHRQLGALPPFEFVAPTENVWAWLVDRGSGVLVAFDWSSEHSYVASFGAAAFGPPLALLLCMASPVDVRKATALALGRPAHAMTIAALGLGLLLTLPVHATHSLHWKPWLFGWRHGLTYGFLVLVAVTWMLAGGSRLLRALGVLVSVFSLVQNGDRIRNILYAPQESPSGLREAAAFLDSRPASTAVALEPQGLSVHTDRGLYWAACWTPPEVLRTLRRHISIRYLLVRPHERACPVFSDLSATAVPIASLAGGRILVFEPAAPK